MKNRFALIAMIFLLAGLCMGPTGCAEKEMQQFAQQMVEAVAIGATQGLVEGMTGNPELAAQAGQDMQNSFDRQRQAALEKELLAALPAGLPCPGGELYFSEQANCYVYAKPDNDWLKWTGTTWIEGE